jgi:hypothetical protein
MLVGADTTEGVLGEIISAELQIGLPIANYTVRSDDVIERPLLEEPATVSCWPVSDRRVRQS